ncbi:MAG: hypothetical protein JO018_04610 [Candidatus Eremiobacteraeota bacterium]|nr:hypothetical protein [Candidatus Eremiobacteraeota bacterium]
MPAFTSSTFGNYSKKWLIATGIFEIALAGVFIAVGFNAPAASGGMFVTAGILGLVGIILIIIALRVSAGAADAQRVSRTGLDGVARITGLTQTGMYLNENPQVKMDLLVQGPGRSPYTASRKEFVPLIMLSQIAPGSSLPVKVDPGNPNDVVIQWDGSLPAAPGVSSDSSETLGQVASALVGSRMGAASPFASAAQGNLTVDQLREYIRQSGIEGTATINQLTDSGRDIGNDRLMTIQSTVNVPGSPPMETPPTAAMVPINVVGKLMVGSTVPVKVAPDNHNAIVVEWEKV